jgi:polysaccharide deacetylase family protein (PEP-CTERM system associated)
MPSSDERRTLLLSIDFEDWHQLVRRRVGVTGWEEPGPALHRQTERLLQLLDELGVRATFFILGMAARAHPDLVKKIADGGHEVACHGDAHRLVHTQTPQEFAADLHRSCATIERLTGRRPLGYRAPAFSITRDTPWAYEVLRDQGFSYDSSQNDSPRIRRRVVPPSAAPHRLAAVGLWEFPLAVWRPAGMRIPLGGASYWGALPTPLILKGLEETAELAGLYLHPYELDPEPLRARLPPSASLSQHAHGALRAGQRNFARQRATRVLKAIARRHRLIPYGEAHAQLSGRATAGP